jgi:hypothetical protein
VAASMAAVADDNLPVQLSTTCMEKFTYALHGNPNANYRFRLASMMGLGLALLVAACLLSFGQKQSPSAEEAANAMVAAIQKYDEQSIMRILGRGKDVVSTGDELQDEIGRELFLRKYHQMHRFVREADFYARLYIGAETSHFRFPWYRKPAAGSSIPRPADRKSCSAAIGKYARALVSCQASSGSGAATKNTQSSGPSRARPARARG